MSLHTDDPAFADYQFAEWLQRTANPMVELDRQIVEEGGLSAFIKLAWHTVENGVPYSHNWHIDALCEYLQAVEAGEIRRLIIAVPPRHMKSVAVAQMFPAWFWTLKPYQRFVFSSYAMTLSRTDSMRCRRIITSEWYQARWGHKFRLTSDQNTKDKFENDKGGYRHATSVGGVMTGVGANTFTIDDPLNAGDADSQAKREGMLKWWKETVSSRLNDPARDSFVIIQQRLHPNDLVGDILKTHGVIEDGGDYAYLCLPAEYEPDHPNRWFRDPRKEKGQLLWPARMPRHALETLKKALGPYGSAGQLQQRPSPREGGTFKRSWFSTVKILPGDLTFARGWDLAASERKVVSSDPDWTATALLAFSKSEKRWFIVDIERWQESPAMIEKRIKQKSDEDRRMGRNVKLVLPQDPGQAGKAQGAAFRLMLPNDDLLLEPQNGDKMTRALPFASQASGGMISLLEADWNEEFLLELAAFPNGAHDDQIDCVASSFTRLTGGHLGLLEYYEAEAAKELARQQRLQDQLSGNGGTLPGLITVTENTSNFGVAMRQNPPPAP